MDGVDVDRQCNVYDLYKNLDNFLEQRLEVKSMRYNFLFLYVEIEMLIQVIEYMINFRLFKIVIKVIKRIVKYYFNLIVVIFSKMLKIYIFEFNFSYLVYLEINIFINVEV